MRFAPIVVLILGWMAQPFAQAVTPQRALPRFEAVSVKPNRYAEAAGGIRVLPQHFEAVKAPAWMLVAHANNLRGYQLVGGPVWLRETFDVRASVAPGSSPEDVRQMLRTMLAERFRLAVHTKTRDVRSYVLVRRGGGKLGRG